MTCVRWIATSAGPTAMPGETPMPVRRSTSPPRSPIATSSTSASTAACSSAPSAEIVIVVPRAAASSRIPMMLLPSITFASRATRICDVESRGEMDEPRCGSRMQPQLR